jgi:hypothetical protein
MGISHGSDSKKKSISILMDTDLLTTAGLSTTGVALLLIIYRLLKSIQGKKLVSSCCGKKIEVGVDVQPMTPIQNPLHSNVSKV